MHDIELTRIQFKNLLSYGSNINEVILNNGGITWIKGPNGSGKSTIIEAITVALFGESYRKIPMKELINAANTSKLWVRLEFIRRDARGETYYVVERSLGRSGSMTFTIWVNGELKDKEAGYSQKYFEDEIIGFNRNLFENVISLNTIQSKPFIDMDAKEKRTLLESIISLHIDKIKKLNSADYSIAMSKYDDAVGDIQKYERRLQDLMCAKDALLREQQDDVNQLKIDIETNTAMVANADLDIAKWNVREREIIARGTELKALSSAYDGLDQRKYKLIELKSLLAQSDTESTRVDTLKQDVDMANANYVHQLTIATELSDQYAALISSMALECAVESFDGLKMLERTISSEITRGEANVSMLSKELDHIKVEADSLTSGVACPTCGKLSTDDDIESIRKSLRSKWKSSNDTKKKLVSEIKVKTDKISIINRHIDVINSCMVQQSSAIGVLNTRKQLLDTATKSLSSYMDSCKSNADRIDTLVAEFGTKDCVAIESDIDNQRIEFNRLETEMASLRSELMVLKNTCISISNARASAKKSTDILTDRLNKRLQSGTGSSLALNKDQIDMTTSDISDARMRLTKFSEEIEVIKYIDTMYGDDGIKKFVLGIFVPNLNRVVAHNIALFSLPFAIEFDDSLDYKFISKFGMAQVYRGLSQGQQRKLNFCISMAFRDFVSLIADFKINLMFLDEVLDVSTDAEGLRDMIELIQQKSTDIQSIYLMSHRGEDFDEEWSHIIEVSNDGLYSKVTHTL